jgi:type II secretion system protein G
MKKIKGFTLIELLIVVAIIAILAAIAVPNFLEAQTRAKVSRVKADFRSLATALESYNVDNKHYPPSYAFGYTTGATVFEASLPHLTTPIAYMSSITILDPFSDKEKLSGPGRSRPLYMYFNYEILKARSPHGPFATADAPSTPFYMKEDWASAAAVGRTNPPLNFYSFSHRAFSVWSPGPDRNDNELYWTEFDYNPGHMNNVYDPSNGTVSWGDIMRLGGAVTTKLKAPNVMY